jgi:uncharacterized paraquat-inducible protein A
MYEVQKCCTKCGYAIPDEIMRCTACGAKQKMSQPGQTVTNAAALLFVGVSAAFLISLVIIIS